MLKKGIDGMQWLDQRGFPANLRPKVSGRKLEIGNESAKENKYNLEGG